MVHVDTAEYYGSAVEGLVGDAISDRREQVFLVSKIMPNDATRLRLIRALITAGHLERVVISHDICYRTRLASFGGHGYGHIFRNVVPMMKKRGYTEDEIDAILVRNPRRLLTFA